MQKRVMGRDEKIAVWMAVVANAILFTGKIIVGVLFNSISIISDSLNSFTDIIASAIVLVSIRSSYKDADAQHPFGHKRAQPIAGLITAIFTGIVGFQVITQSITRLITGDKMETGVLPIILVATVLVVKLGMHVYARVIAGRTGSPALAASAADHRNDVLVSIAVLIGVIASNLGYPVFDPIVAGLIGIWIIGAGYRIGRDNMRYLMGEAPPSELVDRIKSSASSIPGVLALNDVFAHYVGTAVEIEVHINVDPALSIGAAHDIGKRVQRMVEDMEEISRAFIHIDPLLAR